tara:strand:- start:744 stop:947 length:204 start_codon:yes stop_codon:yes gene_type:complete
MAKLIQWAHDEQITAEEFIKRIQPMVCDPIEVMMECDGDMWMSDYSKLVSAFWRLKNATDKMAEDNG